MGSRPESRLHENLLTHVSGSRLVGHSRKRKKDFFDSGSREGARRELVVDPPIGRGWGKKPDLVLFRTKLLEQKCVAGGRERYLRNEHSRRLFYGGRSPGRAGPININIPVH